jgi:hypothetical protein
MKGRILVGIAILCMFLLMGFAGASNTINASAINIIPALNLSSAKYTSYTAAVGACAVCNKTVFNSIKPYAVIHGQIPGNHLYYPYKINNTIYVYNVSIVKNQSYICINLTSSLFSQNICQSGSYRIPLAIINGHFGVNGPTTITITATLSSSLYGSQTSPYNANITVGGTNIFSWSNVNNNTFSVTKTFTYSAGQSLNITLDGGGNSNYSAEDPSVTVPANIVEYVPITFFNYQTTAVGANTPLAVGVKNTVSGNIIGFNALLYEQYYTCNLNNAEFFGSSGSLVYSWLLGNYINAETANTGCTSAISKNALIDSANVVYWILPNSIAPKGFLAAGSASAPSSNTLYLGWAGNVITTANTLFNGITTGEAPELSCTTPQNTISGCGAGQYAEYDNGNVIFTPLYQDFAGTATPSGWSLGGSGISIDNGIQVSNGAHTGQITTSATYNSGAGNTILEFIGKLKAGSNSNLLFGYNGTSTAAGVGAEGCNGVGFCAVGGSTVPPVGYVYDVFGEGTVPLTPFNTKLQISGNIVNIYSTYWGSPTSATFSGNYQNSNVINDLGNPVNTVVIGVGQQTGGGGTPSASFYSVYMRSYPPNGNVPATTFGTPVSPGGCTVSITDPSNVVADVGQYEKFTASEGSCISTYTYNILLSNAISSNVITANQLDSADSATSNVFLYKTTSLDITNSPIHGNVILTSGSGTTNSVYTANFIVYATPTATLTPSADPIVSGGFITYNIMITGGAGSFQVELYNVTGSSQVGSNVIIYSSGGSNTITFVTGATGNFVYNAIFTDLGTTANYIGVQPTNTLYVLPGAAPAPIYLQNATANPAYIFPGNVFYNQNTPPIPFTHTITACTNNWLTGNCVGNVVYTSTQTLTGNIFVDGNITINSGVTLNTADFDIYSNSIFNWQNGALSLGTQNNGGATGGCPGAGSNGGSNVNSYAGSGGGGGSYGSGCLTSNGGSTLIAGTAGNGTTPSAPTLTAVLIKTMYNAGFSGYVNAGGGGGAASTGSASAGGGGADGIYIQAKGVIAGTVNAPGQASTSAQATGGGGGGGAIFIAYGPAGYSAGTYNVLGGICALGNAGNSCSNANSGGAGGNGQVDTFIFATNAVYYPYKLYTLSPSNVLSYYLYQTLNGVVTTLQANVLNLSYIPPANQPSLVVYGYNVVESNSVSSSNTLVPFSFYVSMNDIANAITFDNPIGQKAANFAYCPAWNVVPTSWYIQSDLPRDQYVNQSSPCGDQWSNNNVTFAPTIILTYNSFPYTFTVNLLNNPTITTISQYPFNIVTTNTPSIVASLPYQRRIANVITYDEQSLQGLTANSLMITTLTYNNYTFTPSVIGINTLSYTDPLNVISLWIFNSLYSNPPLIMNSTQITSSAPLHISVTNNYFNSTVNYQTWRQFPIYLPPTANSSQTQFNIYGCSGYGGQGDYLQVYAGSPATLIVQKLISAVPFSLFLDIYGNYNYKIISPSGQILVSQTNQAFASSVSMTIPCGAVSLNYTYPLIQGTCTPLNITNWTSCSATDYQNYVTSYTVDFYTRSSPVSYSNILTNTIIGSSFTNVKYHLPNHLGEIYVNITAHVGSVLDPNFPVITKLLSAQVPNITLSGIQTAFFAIILFLVFLGVAWINEIAAMVGYAVIIFLMGILGIISLTSTPIIVSSIVLFIVAVILAIWR